MGALRPLAPSLQTALLDVLQLHALHLPARAQPQPCCPDQHLQPGHHAQICLLLGRRKPLRGTGQARATQICAGRSRHRGQHGGEDFGVIWCVGLAADRVPNGVGWLLHALLNPVEGPKRPSTAILPPPSSSLSADLVSLNRIRLRSNSTGTKNSAPRGLEPGSSRRLSSQKDGTEKPRTSPGSRVPKSASVSALSLIITSGSSLASAAAAAAAWLPGHEPPSCPCR